MSQRPNFRRVFVLGHSHCGSTLLGRMLDSGRQVFCPGELLWLDDALEKGLPCSCGRALDACAFWAERLARWPRGVLRDYRDLARGHFDGLREETGREVLLDLSKSRVYRARAFRSDSEAGYLLLLRDPRAVIASRLREGGVLEHELRRHRKWSRRFDRMVRRNAARALTVAYEALVQDPEHVLRSVCDFVGIEFDAAMLAPAGREHHFIHSSVSPYLSGTNEIRRDDRWKAELSAIQADRIARGLGSLPAYRDRYPMHDS